MWLAMDAPTSMTGAAIEAAKVALLSQVKTVELDGDSVFLGQFARHGDEPGYLEDSTVPAGSRCPTFAALVLSIDSERWRGVPFLFTAGKGMDERVCELRVRFKQLPANKMMGIDSHNELVMRVQVCHPPSASIYTPLTPRLTPLPSPLQPDESIYMITQAKEPGITAEQHRRPVVMDMSYASQFEGAYVGDAYERMFLNAARGDQALFVSAAELVEAWRIFTPLLHQIDELRPPPALHPFGALPEGYVSWAKHHGVEIHPTWQEYVVAHGSKIEQMTKVFHELDRDGSGALSFAEVTELARRFYDGRVPTEAKVKSIFRAFDKNEKGEVTLDAMLHGVQSMQRAFEMSYEPVRFLDAEESSWGRGRKFGHPTSGRDTSGRDSSTRDDDSGRWKAVAAVDVTK